MKEATRRLLVLAALVAVAPLSWGCGIVYGKDWAFLAEVPDGWSSACHTQAVAGTAITLWPSSQKPDAADSLIYVTASTKGLPTLSDFSNDAIARFKASAPTVKVAYLARPETEKKFNLQLVSFSGAPPGTREELVAYIEGPTAYFIAVITAESESALAQRKQDYLHFVERFIPMERR